MRLPDLDLNLLVVLNVLLQERNVTRAAARLGTTQSTLSSALARLRVQLEDPLLVRSSRGMLPTPRALALQPALHQALQSLGEALQPDQAFDPASSKRTFVVAATDYLQFALLPPLMRRLQMEAPGVRIEVQGITHRFLWEDLAIGETDLILAGRTQALEGLQSRQIFTDEVVCLVRQGHPCLSSPFDLEAYLALAHVEAHPIEGQTLVDEMLAEAGRTRHIALVLPQYLAAPTVVQDTDLCFTVSRRVAERLAASLPLAILPTPFPCQAIRVRAYWHSRMQDDPAHRWFRTTMAEVAGVEAAP